MKKAFTLIELIFVITIVGILATVGTDMFLNLFNSYTSSKNQNSVKLNTELALNKIAARLEHRIHNSLILSQNASAAYTLGTTITQPVFALEWLGKDNDSKRGMASSLSDSFVPPAVSSFIDLAASNKDYLQTPGSNLSNATQIVSSLSYNDINLSDCSAGTNAASLIFTYEQGTASDYGWYSGNTTLVHPVCRFNDTTFTHPTAVKDFSTASNTEVFEQYEFVFSAYALELNTSNSNLTLYYNYQPWNAETYLNGNHSLIAENVSTFQFVQLGDILKIQLCIKTSENLANNNGANGEFAYCKEKALF